MKQSSLHFLLPSVLTVLALLGVACSSRSDYPDSSAETVRKVDDIKREGRDRKDEIDRLYDAQLARFDFREKQIHDKARADRDAIDLDIQKAHDNLNDKKRESDAKAKRETEAVEAEAEAKLKTAPPEQTDRIKADLATRKAEIALKSTEEMAPISSDLAAFEGKTKQRKMELESEETKQLNALEHDQAEARRQMREKRLDVDRWVTENLAKVAKEHPDASIEKTQAR